MCSQRSTIRKSITAYKKVIWEENFPQTWVSFYRFVTSAKICSVLALRIFVLIEVPSKKELKLNKKKVSASIFFWLSPMNSLVEILVNSFILKKLIIFPPSFIPLYLITVYDSLYDHYWNLTSTNHLTSWGTPYTFVLHLISPRIEAACHKPYKSYKCVENVTSVSGKAANKTLSGRIVRVALEEHAAYH